MVFWHFQHSPTLLMILNVHLCYSSLINVMFIVWCSQLVNWHSLVLLAFFKCSLSQTKTLPNYNLSFQVYIFIRTPGLKQLMDVHKDTYINNLNHYCKCNIHLFTHLWYCSKKNLNDKLKLDLYYYVKHEVMEDHKVIKTQSKEPPKWMYTF